MNANNFSSLGERRGKPAFTLAETLITLVIIGVIAALTVPSLVNTNQKEEYVVRLKKSYSTIQQVIQQMAADKGLSQGDYSFVNEEDFFDNFAKKLNTAKYCKNSESCYGNKAYRLNNNIVSVDDISKSIITNDGIVYSYTDRTSYNYFGLAQQDRENYLGRFTVNLNGARKPNKCGLDIFSFVVINSKGIFPAGYGNNSNDCNRNSDGFQCAAKVLKENTISY